MRSLELLGFRTLSVVRYSENYKTQHSVKWIYFRPQVSPVIEDSSFQGTQQSRCLSSNSVIHHR